MMMPHLLIIDDEAQIRRVFTRMLSRHFVTDSVDDVQTALDLIDDGSLFDVFLCDLNLPHLSGQDFYEGLKSRSSSLAERVVILTGAEPAEDDAFAMLLGERYRVKTGAFCDLITTLMKVAFGSSPFPVPVVAA